MTSARRARERAGIRRGSAGSPAFAIGLVLAAAFGAIVAVVAATDDEPSTRSLREPAYVTTGERNEMGVPVIETPGSASGVVRAAGAEVEGATWRMGTVPLDVAVLPSWTIVNTTSRPMALGEPHPDVRAGCCPGAFTFGARRLTPGASTTLTFELAMHTGMDGWHDIVVHVPVRSSPAERVLSLRVTGDFRGSLA